METLNHSRKLRIYSLIYSTNEERKIFDQTNKYFAEMQQLKDIITKLKHYQQQNYTNMKLDSPDESLLLERDNLRKVLL